MPASVGWSTFTLKTGAALAILSSQPGRNSHSRTSLGKKCGGRRRQPTFAYQTLAVPYLQEVTCSRPVCGAPLSIDRRFLFHVMSGWSRRRANQPVTAVSGTLTFPCSRRGGETVLVAARMTSRTLIAPRSMRLSNQPHMADSDHNYAQSESM